MFLDFMLFLRTGGLKVSLHDWLSLMDGLDMGLHGQTIKGFYILCRTLIVKTESDLDRFDELFCSYFKNCDSGELKKSFSELLQDPEAAHSVFKTYLKKNDLEFQAIKKALEMRLDISEAESGSGTYMDTGSSIYSSISSAGAGPGGISGSMIQGSGGRSVIHAQGSRRFRDWRTDCTIESRQFQMAFRLLRELSRKLDVNEEELDIHGTIESTCRKGGILDIQMQPPRKNRLKLMLLMDSGGSMRPYEQLCSLLFQSLHKANTFSDLKIYYFHNCLENRLYEDPSIDTLNTVNTEWVLKNITNDYKVIFVGDADMAIHELTGGPYGSLDDLDPDGLTWFRRFSEKYRHSIWLHPQEREENAAWMPESFIEIEKIFPMFRLSIDGLKEAMYKLMKY